MEEIEKFLKPVTDWLESTIPFIQEGQGIWWFLGACALVLLLLILLIVLCVNAKKKKKAKRIKDLQAQKSSSYNPNEPVKKEEAPIETKEELKVEEEVEPVVEDEVKPVEEVKEEPVEETKVEEVTPAPSEEEKEEEPADEPKEEPKEESKEEVTLDEEEKEVIKKLVKKVEKAEKEEKKPAKKAPAKKKASAKKDVDEDKFMAEPQRVLEVPKEEEKKTTKKAKKVEEEKASLANGKFILVPEGDNWRYKLLASNGQIIIVSEPYTSEKSVRTGIETLKKNLDSEKLSFVKDKHNLYYFMVFTKQGRCLATSASYKTKASATSASESYKRWAETTVIEVDTEGDSEHTEVEKFEVEVEQDNTGTYVIRKEGDGFLYQLVAANGVVVATSQVYASKDSCKEACDAFKELVYKGTFFISKDKNSLYQFKLYNKQNRLMLAGEVYEDKSRVVSVIESIKRLAKLAKIEDQTKE